MSSAFPKAGDFEWSIGRRLDRYEVLGEIARGGMGTVLLARLAGTGGFSRLFALKMLHRHLAGDEQFVNMLLDEARLASRIHHSNVVPVLDVCHSEHGLYVVMEYIEGFPFSAILAAPAFSAEERIGIGVQVLLGVLAGLEAAHNLTDDDGVPFGLVHRDVSPHNVLVGVDGVARIGDFGIAQAAARLTHTEPGMIKGKVAYMAPESVRGEPTDRRADVFCVGIMLWECLTGRRLFKAENDAATALRLFQDVIGAPSVHQGRSSRPSTPSACRRCSAVSVGALRRRATWRRRWRAPPRRRAARRRRLPSAIGCACASPPRSRAVRRGFAPCARPCRARRRSMANG